MRIISKERDYYDGYQNHDKKDRFNKLYIRNAREIWINVDRIKEINQRRMRIRSVYWEAMFMVLAGKVVPFISKRIPGAYQAGGSYIEEHYKSYFNADDAWAAYGVDKDDDHARKWWGGRMKHKDFVEFFRPYADLSELNIYRDTPVILVRPDTPQYAGPTDYTRTAYANINLKRYGFTKYMDAPTMYQEIDVFVSNVLINDDMPTTPMTEKEKMQQHGFTHEYSFRKEPGKKDKL